MAKKERTWEDLYATKVKPDEILYVVTNMARLHEEGKNPDFHTAMFLVTDRHKGKKGSERETVTPPDGMGVLIFGDSGYTRQDERDGLEQSTGLAGVSGLPTRNR